MKSWSAFFALFFLFNTLEAEVLRVYNRHDSSDPGTIRTVLSNASEGDQILFTASAKSIVLTQGELLIDKNITLSGPDVTLSAKHQSRLLHIVEGKSVTIEKMILVEGYDKEGGAIFNQGDLTLKNCTLSHNYAEGSGGALMNLKNAVLIQTILSENRSDSGGALCNLGGQMTIQKSLLVSNHSTSHSGAIFNNWGRLQIEESTLASNTAEGEGGAIMNNLDSTLVAKNSQFINNSSGLDGGAIWNNLRANGSSLILDHCSFVSNSTADSFNGGAIFVSEGGGISEKECQMVLNSPDDIFRD